MRWSILKLPFCLIRFNLCLDEANTDQFTYVYAHVYVNSVNREILLLLHQGEIRGTWPQDVYIYISLPRIRVQWFTEPICIWKRHTKRVHWNCKRGHVPNIFDFRKDEENSFDRAIDTGNETIPLSYLLSFWKSSYNQMNLSWKWISIFSGNFTRIIYHVEANLTHPQWRINLIPQSKKDENSKRFHYLERLVKQK